jgi:hypothetical protein
VDPRKTAHGKLDQDKLSNMAKSAKKSAAKRPLYGIHRVDNAKNHTHAWIVTLQRRNKIWCKYFSDGKFGSKPKALAAAKAFRDSTLDANPPMSRADYASIRRRNNKSGVVGVCRHVSIEVRDGRKVKQPYWIAFWPLEGKRVGRAKFAVSRHGEDKAFKLAVAARKTALKELKQDPFANSSGLKRWLRSSAA